MKVLATSAGRPNSVLKRVAYETLPILRQNRRTENEEVWDTTTSRLDPLIHGIYNDQFTTDQLFKFPPSIVRGSGPASKVQSIPTTGDVKESVFDQTVEARFKKEATDPDDALRISTDMPGDIKRLVESSKDVASRDPRINQLTAPIKINQYSKENPLPQKQEDLVPLLTKSKKAEMTFVNEFYPKTT